MADDRVTKALHGVMDALATSDPLKLRKGDLLNMRQHALNWAVYGLGEEIEQEPLRIDPTKDEGYADAVRMVAAYAGRNRFMRDLKRSLEVHGSLTQRQAEVVLDPPDVELMDELRALGVQNDFQYRWQALDARTAAKAELRKQAAGG